MVRGQSPSFAERYSAEAHIDLRSWTPTEKGRLFNVRCRIPVELWSGGSIRRNADELREIATDVAKGMTSASRGNKAVVEGVASSTSTDWYGTEMTLACLEYQAMQFSRGVAYVPTHRLSEWMDSIGKTRAAGVFPAVVASPYDKDEQGYILRTSTEVDLTKTWATELLERVAEGMEIGQSIGGWFTKMRFVFDEAGDFQRAFVDEVELDHLAATRSPANPDGWIEKVLSALEQADHQARSMWPEGEEKPASIYMRRREPMLRGIVGLNEYAEATVGGPVETKSFHVEYAARSMGTIVHTPGIVAPEIKPDARATELDEIIAAETAAAGAEAEAATEKPADETPPDADRSAVVDEIVARALVDAQPEIARVATELAITAVAEKHGIDPAIVREHAKNATMDERAAPPAVETLSVPAIPAEPDPTADGRASAPDASTTKEGVDMTPEEIALLGKSLGEAVVSGLAPALGELSSKVGALEQRQAAAPAPETKPNVDPRDAEIEALRAKVEDREATIGRLAREPGQRTGMTAFRGGPGPDGKHEGPWQRTIRVAREANLIALAEFMTPEHIRNLGEGRSYAYPDIKHENSGTDIRGYLADDLRGFLNAAEADGALDEWFRSATH